MASVVGFERAARKQISMEELKERCTIIFSSLENVKLNARKEVMTCCLVDREPIVKEYFESMGPLLEHLEQMLRRNIVNRRWQQLRYDLWVQFKQQEHEALDRTKDQYQEVYRRTNKKNWMQNYDIQTRRFEKAAGAKRLSESVLAQSTHSPSPIWIEERNESPKKTIARSNSPRSRGTIKQSPSPKKRREQHFQRGNSCDERQEIGLAGSRLEELLATAKNRRRAPIIGNDGPIWEFAACLTRAMARKSKEHVQNVAL